MSPGLGETMNGYAEIDISALRRSAMTNILARQRLGILRRAYDLEPVYPANNLLNEEGVQALARRHYMDVQKSVIESLQKRGII